MVSVYGLCEPESGEIRYIGAAFDPYRRFASHVRDRSDSPVGRWVASLAERNTTPTLRILATSENGGIGAEEQRWIAETPNLLNRAPGGEGAPGGRRPGPPRSVRIMFRATEKESARIRELAAEHKMTVSGWIRERVVAQMSDTP